MGQAKQRGSKEDRINDAQAQGKGDKPYKLHAFLNATRMEQVVLSNFPCADCGASVVPNAEQNEVFETPVKHAVQVGICPICHATHFIISASTTADCVVLEPAFAVMQKVFINSNS